jgi:hypothetical protein
MQMKSLYLIGLIAVAVATVQAQPTNGAQYWSSSPPDCSSLNETTPTPIKDAAGHLLGYSCYVSGTFVWLAAGGEWGTTIRVAAPASAPIGVDYSFYDQSGTPSQSLDSTINSDPSTLSSGNDVNFALYANQPAEIELLGFSSDAPNYGNTADGTVYAVFYCPDATTCSNVLPQLLYSALPSQPWSLSVPIAWDDNLSSQWSAVGIDDGVTNVVSFAIYNEDSVANSYTIDVYDSNGDFCCSGTTPSIPPIPSSGTADGGVYAVLLEQVVSGLPSGPFKILIDGGQYLSAVEVLQINGTSATTLQVAFDTAPSDASAVKRARSSAKKLRVAASPKHVFPTLKTRARSK